MRETPGLQESIKLSTRLLILSNLSVISTPVYTLTLCDSKVFYPKLTVKIISLRILTDIKYSAHHNSPQFLKKNNEALATCNTNASVPLNSSINLNANLPHKQHSFTHTSLVINTSMYSKHYPIKIFLELKLLLIYKSHPRISWRAFTNSKNMYIVQEWSHGK